MRLPAEHAPFQCACVCSQCVCLFTDYVRTCVQGLTGYLMATTHDDFLQFHYGAEKTAAEARTSLEVDTRTACETLEYKVVLWWRWGGVWRRDVLVPW